ncbi:Zn(II)2Cys6 transcription factor [Aspergillus homomorphus CBS 101889]|uniref:Zn(2)-C6 fungal-type domain-containing protein n=1 Tax=Aspergillus homomorphus (strain CBS 101889) TaxID=1450537 RepID=A0A395I258_ASPHC|nr:hypothetical protein BO97DRAFT_442127 [Aspergillus homomorphus CBS 101889]RAL13815.1 hypothetical protein BO97DRAFT_442127 [Aspergillus homomorphus CBS 101889]
MRGYEATPLKACRPCSKAKVRCDPGPSQACQRCHRLRKECTKQAPGAHSLGRPKALSDVGRLERKLDNMTTLLRASQQPRGGIVSNSGYLSPAGAVPVPGSGSPKEANPHEAIEIFHRQMAIRFPFVLCSPSMSRDELRVQKPFVYMVMSMIGCQDQDAQLALADQARAYLLERVLGNGESSLDLFQGFLLFVAWAHIYVPMPELWCNYLHLLVAQSKNLGLARDVSSGAPISVLSYMKCRQFERPTGPARSLEERKAYLGCYYVVTMISMYLGESEPMHYTTYMEESYQVLKAAAQTESDRYLLCLVDIARLADRIHRTLQPDSLNSPSNEAASFPRGIAIRWLRRELEQLKPALAFSDPVQSSFLLLQYHNLELFIYRTALRRDPTSRECSYPPTRLTILHNCLHSAKAFFDAFFAVPSAAFFQMPYVFYCQLGHAFLILSQLSVYDDEDDDPNTPERALWDRDYARGVIDWHATADTLTQKIEEAVRVAREERILVPKIFGKIAVRLSWWREAHARQEEALRLRLRQRAEGDVRPPTPDMGSRMDDFGMEELVSGLGLEDLFMVGPMWEFFPF